MDKGQARFCFSVNGTYLILLAYICAPKFGNKLPLFGDVEVRGSSF